MTDNEIIKALELCIDDECRCGECPYFGIASDSVPCGKEHGIDMLDLINRQNAEIERLTEERDRTVKDFTEFARTAYDLPFACKYCAHSVADGRACLWKSEHEDEEETCLGRHFEYKGTEEHHETQ